MDNWSKTRSALWLTAAALSLLSSVPTAAAAPSRSTNHSQSLNNTQHFVESGFPVLGLKARDTSITLRIMPLGASIMSGVGSSNGNGYESCLLSMGPADTRIDFGNLFETHSERMVMT